MDFFAEVGRKLGIEESVYFKEIMRLAENLDNLLLVDRVEGFINWVSTERACRRLAGLEAAFQHCRSPADWRKPRGSPNTWKPKTLWRECDLIDPSWMDATTFRDPGLEKEIQRERERIALQAKAQAKMATLGVAQSGDPRDAVPGAGA